MKKIVETLVIDYAEATGLHERQLPKALRESGDLLGCVNTAAFLFNEPGLVHGAAGFVMGSRAKMANALGMSERTFTRWWAAGSLDWMCRYENVFAMCVNSAEAARFSIANSLYDSDAMRARSAATLRADSGQFKTTGRK